MIYFARSQASDLIKIGFSARPAARIRDLQGAHGGRLKIVRLIAGTVDDERRIHARFAEHRQSGEWFKACPEMLSEDFGLTELPLPEKAPRRIAKPLPNPEFLARVEAALVEHHIAPGIFGINAVKDPQFVFDLRKGRECRASTRVKVLAFINALALRRAA